MDWLVKAHGDVESIPEYGCTDSNRTTGYVNIWLGISFLVYGLAAELVYSIVLSVMMREQHRHLSCYKIMIVLGVYDMVALALNSLLTGYFWIVGANYCYCPRLMFVTGCIALGLWCGACMNCFVLVINRLLEVSNKQMMQMVFGGRRTYLVLVIPAIYCLYFALYTPPLLFNSDHMAWFFATFAPNTDIEKVRGKVVVLKTNSKKNNKRQHHLSHMLPLSAEWPGPEGFPFVNIAYKSTLVG
ncbi:hypothetical protein Angca_006990, partial [Angiostrongylus cantonensis]